MGQRSVVDPWTFQTYNYDWNEADDPTPEQEKSILEKERQRKGVQKPVVDRSSLVQPEWWQRGAAPSIVQGLKKEPAPIESPVESPPPDLLTRMKEQPTLGSAIKFGLSTAMDPVGAATGDPEWPRKIIGPDEALPPTDQDPASVFINTAGVQTRNLARRFATKALPIISSPVSAYLSVPGAATSIPGKLAIGGFGVQGAVGVKGGVEEIATMIGEGKKLTDPDVMNKMAELGIDATMVLGMLAHGRGGLADIAEHPGVVAAAKRVAPSIESTARGMGWQPSLAEGTASHIVPPEWLAKEGYRKVGKRWVDKEGKPVTAPEIQSHFDTGERAAPEPNFQRDVLDVPPPSEEVPGQVIPTDLGKEGLSAEVKPAPEPRIMRRRTVEESAPAPFETERPIEFQAPEKQLGFEEWRNLPENRRFYGGKPSPDRMKTALADYNKYATDFARSKVRTASAEPKTVEEMIGDVGELPEESVQTVNASGVESDMVDVYRAGDGSFFTTNRERAASYPGRMTKVRVPRAVFEAGKPEAAKLGQPTPQDTVLPDEWVRQAAEVEKPDVTISGSDLEPTDRAALMKELGIIEAEPETVKMAREFAAERPVEPAPNQAEVDAAHEAQLGTAMNPEVIQPPEHPTVYDRLPGDTLEKAGYGPGATREQMLNPDADALQAIQDDFRRTNPEAAKKLDEINRGANPIDIEATPVETRPERQLPTGNFTEDVLKQPVPEAPVGSEETVQRALGTILPEASKAELPTPPEKIVPGPETIVQEPSSTLPTQAEAAKPTSPEAAAVLRKLTIDNVLEDLYPGKESFTKTEIQAARKELMSRLRGKKETRRATTEDALHQGIETPQPGEEGPPPTQVAKVAVKGEGKAPKMPLGSPGLASRIALDLRTNLGKIHPHLARWVDKFQRESELPAMNAIAERRALTEGLSGGEKSALWRILDEKGAEELAVARELKDQVKINDLLKSDPTLKDVLTELNGNPDLVDKAANLRDLLDRVHKEAEANKVAIGYRQHYAPHYFKEGGFRPNVKPRAMPRTGTTTRRMSKLEKQRLTMRSDYIKDLNVLDEYFMQAYQRISEAENFGKRHEKIAKWFEQTEGTDPRVAQYFDKAIQRITGNEEPSWIRGALGKARRFQALSDLGLAAPLQLGQASHTSAYGGVMRSLEAAKDMTRSGREIGLRALKNAALTPDIGIESLGAARGGGVTSGKFLWGIPTMDKAMRVHAFRVGELLHRDVLAGNSGAIRSLERLGIKDVSKVTAEQIGKLLSDKSQFKTGYLDLPLWSTSPLGRTATMYTSFMYQHTKFMGQMFRHPVDNAAAIARFAVVGALAGEGVGWIRAGLKGRNPLIDEKFRRKEAEWIETLRNRRIPWSSPAKRLIQNYALLGGVGIFQTYFERLNAPDVTLAGIAGGPIASNVEDLARGVAQQKKLKGKAKAVGKWGLEQVPIYGYELGEAAFPRKKRSADPLMSVE